MNASHIFSPRWGAVAVTGALLGGLALLNAAAIREIIDARGEARRLAEREMELRLEERGQAYRARLANLRSDLVALAESPALSAFSERIASSDPVVRRWARLDAEGTMVLFVQSRPALRELWLSTPGASDPVRVGRRAGSVEVLVPSGGGAEERQGWPSLEVALGAGGDASVRGWIEPGRVLGVGGDPNLEGVTLQPMAPSLDATGIVRSIAVEDTRWEPPIQVWLVARQEESPVERSVAALAARYRRTVIWNLVVILALSAMVALTLVQLRRRMRAEAAANEERRVRELERGLLHSERLASVGRFAAGVAHEVNNPLEGMSNYLRLLESDIEAGDTGKARERVARVQEGLERAAAVVRRVLTFSDPASAPKEPVPVVEPLREAVDFLGPRFPGIAIEVADRAEGARILASRVALSQLFLNVLLNACEGQQDGEIRVELLGDGRSVTIRVTDQGPGLEDGSTERLFEPFYSTRGSSGLGLAVCHGILQDHGGEISAANAPGGSGAVFEIRLPRVAAPRLVEA